MKRKIVLGSMAFIIILIVILIVSYLWKNRFKYMESESLNYQIKSNEISKIGFYTLKRENHNYYIFDEQGEIDSFINELNNLELINVGTDYDMNISPEKNSSIVFSIYKVDEYQKYNTIAVYDKYILVFNEWEDKVIGEYVIKDTYYQDSPQNVFNKFIDDKYLDVETNNMAEIRREELRKSTTQG